MAKVRITRQGFETFTGFMGSVPFENGMSSRDVTQREANILGAVTTIEILGDGIEPSMAERLATRRDEAAPVLETMPRAGDIKNEPERVQRPDVEVKEPESTTPDSETEVAMRDLDRISADLDAEAEVEVAPEKSRLYTREELEELADSEGISGLRKIADPLGVRDRSIDGLIREIMAVRGAS